MGCKGTIPFHGFVLPREDGGLEEVGWSTGSLCVAGPSLGPWAHGLTGWPAEALSRVEGAGERLWTGLGGRARLAGPAGAEARRVGRMRDFLRVKSGEVEALGDRGSKGLARTQVWV